MSDPFRPEANQQLMREARIGLTLLAVTLGTFVYVAYYRISGNGVRLPEYVVSAPIAKSVWPGENPLPLAEKKQAPQSLGSQFGNLLANARHKFGIDGEDAPAASLRRQSNDYQDPTPRKVNAPLPENSAAEIESVANNAADLPTQKQVSTTPMIVTPRRVADSEFAAVPLRPFSESADSQPAKSNDFAPALDSANPIPSSGLKPGQSARQQLTDANSNSHEGSPISSQISTSEFAANLDKPTLESTALDGQAAKQTSFDSESQLPSNLVGDVKTETKSNESSTNTISPPQCVVDKENNNPQEHLVLAGESFWSISQQHYHDGRFFRALYEYNKQSVGGFENLLPGSTLATPPLTELNRLWPELCPETDQSSAVSTNVAERIYITQQGDTLFEIARQRLDQASRYLEIQELNQVRLPDGVNHLTPLPAGIQLVLPFDVGH